MITLPLLALSIVAAPPLGVLTSIPAKYLPQPPAMAKTVVTVNGKAVKGSDVQSLMWAWYSTQTTDELVNYLVVKTEAEKQGVKVPTADVDAEMAKQIKLYANQLGPGANVDDALNKQGFHRSRLFLAVEAQLLTKKLMLRRFDPAEYVKVSTIIVKPKSEQASDLGDAVKKAEEAYAKLTAGTPWDDVLKAYTNDPNALSAKGILGWRIVSIFPKNVQDEFKKAKPGGFTKPTQTQVGIQVFRLDMLGKDAKGAELNQLKDSYVASGQREFVDKLRKQAKIVWPK